MIVDELVEWACMETESLYGDNQDLSRWWAGSKWCALDILLDMLAELSHRQSIHFSYLLYLYLLLIQPAIIASLKGYATWASCS